MRLKLAADGDTIVLESELKSVTAGATIIFLSVAVFLVLDWTHPFSSLECVRHEWNSGGSYKEKWEDNDCELLVRRRWSTDNWRVANSEASSPHSRAVDAGAAVLPTDALAATTVATPAATLRAAALRVLGVQEHLYSFEIKSVSSLTPRRLSAPAGTTTPLGAEPADSIPTALGAADTMSASSVPEQRHPRSSALTRQRQHHLRPPPHPPPTPEVWVPMVLRDQLGRNYTFFTFSDGEQAVAAQLHRAVTTYLAAAADHSGGNDALAMHLSLAYPDGWSWEEAAALIGCLLFVLLAWYPSRESVRFSGRGNVVEIKHATCIWLPRLHLAVTLDAVSHLALVQELSFALAPRTSRGLVQHAVSTLKLYLRASALPKLTLEKLRARNRRGSHDAVPVLTPSSSSSSTSQLSWRSLYRRCCSSLSSWGLSWRSAADLSSGMDRSRSYADDGDDSREGGGGGGARLVDVTLGLGLRDADPALFKRAVEAVSALLLDQRNDRLPSLGSSSSSSRSSSGNDVNDACHQSSTGSITSGKRSSSHSSSDFLYGATTAPLGLISRNNSGIINSGSGNGSSSSNSCSGSSGTDVNNSVSRENVYSSGFQDPQRQFGASESCAMDGRCVVCLQARARVAFFPCRHMKVCKVCADECDTCPICRAKIKDKHVIYF